jgi:hypothetical protein
MDVFTVGIDPDSERHGFAVYKNGKLIVCATATNIEIFNDHLPELLAVGMVVFSIENVMQNEFVYARNRQASKAAESRVAMSIGRCQQAQLELMRCLDHARVPYVLHAPQAGNWKDKKALFEKITGWTGRSNEDSRAAAFFGWLALKK